MAKRSLTAKTADKFELYEKSVQAADVEARFFSRRFKRMTGRPLRLFREDFCGTAKMCAEFVTLHRENRACGIDLDAKTLRWAEKHNLGQLTEDQRERVTLIQANVLDVHRPKVELIAACNFSYFVFKTRQALLAYLKSVRRSLVEDGVVFFDVYGGAEAQLEQIEKRRVSGFTYLWDQVRFDPVTHDTLCKIHFAFRDGSEMRNAFVYDWRLWTLPELQELFQAAGFREVHVLWEGTDEKGEGNGVFRRVKHGDADKSWIAYVVGRR